VAIWFVLFLAVADVAVSALFPLPRDPRKRGNALSEYFNYGLSIESKIRRAVQPTNAASAPLTQAGWIDDEVAQGRKAQKVSRGDLVVSFYGMSFSNDIARTLAQVDPKVRIRLFSGPAAPPNHSFAIYSLDRGGPSRVVVLAVLGSSVPGLVTNNGMTWRFEGPAPFTYPRYEPHPDLLKPDLLKAEWPVVRTLNELRKRLDNPAGWDEYVAQLRATDGFYNPFLFRRDLGDRSAIVRMIRRAVAQRWQAFRIAQIHGPRGFDESSDAIRSLRGIVVDFAADARREGKLPIVLLIQDQGYRDHLYKVLQADLGEKRIPYLSTHALCPDTDRKNFVPDGHFTAEAYQKIATALLELIHRELSATPDLSPAAPAAKRG
jgi:hypothetical protein